MTDSYGDESLVAAVRELAGERHRVIAAATITPEGTAVAGVGAAPEADFEIGSISKGVTGLLYADALERGEIDSATTLGDLLPLGSAPAARLALAALGTHRSGLPSLPPAAAPRRRAFDLWMRGRNPYGDDLGELIAQARQVRPGEPRPRYSNLGFELLGHAVAAAANMTYEDLLRQRIVDPLRLGVCYAPASRDRLRAEALIGTSPFGRKRQPWTGEAVGPAGGIRASIDAMARLAAAFLDGSAPGIAALDPVTEFAPGVGIGTAWVTVERDGRRVTWHNGGTGGFRTWFGLDRAAGTGAVVMSATARSVDDPGFLLLERVTERSRR